MNNNSQPVNGYESAAYTLLEAAELEIKRLRKHNDTLMKENVRLLILIAEIEIDESNKTIEKLRKWKKENR